MLWFADIAAAVDRGTPARHQRLEDPLRARPRRRAARRHPPRRHLPRAEGRGVDGALPLRRRRLRPARRDPQGPGRALPEVPRQARSATCPPPPGSKATDMAEHFIARVLRRLRRARRRGRALPDARPLPRRTDERGHRPHPRAKADVVRQHLQGGLGLGEGRRDVAPLPGRLRALRAHRHDRGRRLRRQGGRVPLPPAPGEDGPRRLRRLRHTARCRPSTAGGSCRGSSSGSPSGASFGVTIEGAGQGPHHQGRRARRRRRVLHGALRRGAAAQHPVRVLPRRGEEDELLEGRRRLGARDGRLPRARGAPLPHPPHAAADAGRLPPRAGRPDPKLATRTSSPRSSWSSSSTTSTG